MAVELSHVSFALGLAFFTLAFQSMAAYVQDSATLLRGDVRYVTALYTRRAETSWV
jgi:hypothetical protein